MYKINTTVERIHFLIVSFLADSKQNIRCIKFDILIVVHSIAFVLFFSVFGTNFVSSVTKQAMVKFDAQNACCHFISDAFKMQVQTNSVGNVQNVEMLRNMSQGKLNFLNPDEFIEQTFESYLIFFLEMQ